jgi:hypothetical protein
MFIKFWYYIILPHILGKYLVLGSYPSIYINLKITPVPTRLVSYLLGAYLIFFSKRRTKTNLSYYRKMKLIIQWLSNHPKPRGQTQKTFF